MKLFNLERAIAGDPVVTADGRPYKFGAYNPDTIRENEKVIGWVGTEGLCYTHDKNGRFSSHADSAVDLFMATKKRTVYINLYYDGSAKYFDDATTATLPWSTQDAFVIAKPLEIEE